MAGRNQTKKFYLWPWYFLIGLFCFGPSAYATYPATIDNWYDYGYAPGKLSMPPSGAGRIDDWHNRWPGHPDMYLVPSQCANIGQGLIIHCTTTSCSGGFTCRANLSCPDGSAPNYTNNTCPGTDNRKSMGEASDCNKGAIATRLGNPCDAATGNKFQKEIDYADVGTGLSFVRFYNSGNMFRSAGRLGYGWTHQLGSNLVVTGTGVVVNQADGRSEVFKLVNGIWTGDADTQLVLTQDSNGFTLGDRQGSRERYYNNGLIQSRTTPNGRITSYGYDASQRLITVTGPFGHQGNRA